MVRIRTFRPTEEQDRILNELSRKLGTGTDSELFRRITDICGQEELPRNVDTRTAPPQEQKQYFSQQSELNGNTDHNLGNDHSNNNMKDQVILSLSNEVNALRNENNGLRKELSSVKAFEKYYREEGLAVSDKLSQLQQMHPELFWNSVWR
jgi:hypothetical protein